MISNSLDSAAEGKLASVAANKVKQPGTEKGIWSELSMSLRAIATLLSFIATKGPVQTLAWLNIPIDSMSQGAELLMIIPDIVTSHQLERPTRVFPRVLVDFCQVLFVGTSHERIIPFPPRGALCLDLLLAQLRHQTPVS